MAIASAGLWAACDLYLGDNQGRESGAIECTSSGAPGSSKYCSAACPCDEDEGDCDSDAECVAGLECRKDVGASYGWDPEVDVCVTPCSTVGKDVSDICSVECPCGDGVGDCDSDAECEPGGLCLKDAGVSYGYTDPEVDVCVIGCPTAGNGASNYCSTACPCDAGEGDCDGDDECAPGLECEHDVGASYGLDPDVDVCEGMVSTCADDAFEGNDTAGDATWLSLGNISWDGDDGHAGVHIHEVELCGGNEDWYLIPSSELPYPLSVIKVRFRSLESGWCSAMWCGDVELPPAPENTLTVEMFDATGTVYLDGWTSDIGRIKKNLFGDLSAYSGDFLIRVSGPAAAQFSYEFLLELQTGLFEDECEC